MLEVLKEVDSSFRAIPHINSDRITRYVAKGGLRVDFLTPNEGPDTDEPQPLPALQTDAQPLRFLDFLIHDPEPAVLLHGPGIYVNVPAPERYALHKLIIAKRRPEGAAKSDKDIHQAGALLDVLWQRRPHELNNAWKEAVDRGKTWRKYLFEGMLQLKPRPRDGTLKVIGALRKDLAGLDLRFNNPPARYDFSRDVVIFVGEDNGGTVQCAISREALDDHFGTDGFTDQQRLDAFRRRRSEFERIVRNKYLSMPIEEPGEILIRTDDVFLLEQVPKAQIPAVENDRTA
jgi:hypothetical protein